jgi:hypothetical protein
LHHLWWKKEIEAYYKRVLEETPGAIDRKALSGTRYNIVDCVLEAVPLKLKFKNRV